jgi:formate C-acetyltransferase
MGAVTLQDIRLREYSLENLPLLKRLREGLLSERPKVCIERAKYFTEYLKDRASDRDAAEIRYANAARYCLSKKAPLFFDDNLLAGTTTSKPFGAPVYPEWTGMTIWPELDTISTREKNPLILSKRRPRP